MKTTLTHAGQPGFGVNEVSGMMFYIATPKGYTTNPIFYWKLIFLLIAAADLLLEELIKSGLPA